jgi:hypothetical protein
MSKLPTFSTIKKLNTNHLMVTSNIVNLFASNKKTYPHMPLWIINRNNLTQRRTQHMDMGIEMYTVGGPKIGGSSRTQEIWTKTRKSRATRRQGISERLYSPQKLWIPLHVPSRPLFIGRWWDFYIPRLPLNLENIPSVDIYMNVFYISWFAGLISHIYKSATSSHSKPDFWSDIFDLASSKTPKLLFMKTTSLRDSRNKTSPDSRTSQIPESQNFTSFRPPSNR